MFRVTFEAYSTPKSDVQSDTYIKDAETCGDGNEKIPGRYCVGIPEKYGPTLDSAVQERREVA